jgi:plastocyanin
MGSLALLLGTGAFLVGCGSSSPTTPTGGGGGGAADVTITIVGIDGNMSFNPAPASVKVGQTVSWRNSDAIAHDVAQDAGAWDTGTVSPGSTSAPIKMSAAGTFNYHCSFHPSMVASLTVQ